MKFLRTTAQVGPDIERHPRLVGAKLESESHQISVTFG
ncbi:hypothetical protein GFS60_05400 [Rhodococcus sp. WAY2]|nr:hypothetical protein GFS60_05400 [Rhodococcus sp. WAY2]